MDQETTVLRLAEAKKEKATKFKTSMFNDPEGLIKHTHER